MPGQIVVLMATAIIERNGKYLVLRRSNNNITNKGKWQFPEGKVKFGEDVVKTLKREVEEETNLVAVNPRMFGIHSSILKEANRAFRVFRTVFKCRTLGKIKLSKDHSEFAWVSRKDMAKMDFIEGFNFNDVISVKR